MPRPQPVPLPGMENLFDQELDDKARAYRFVRDARMEHTKQEVQLKGELLKLMQDKGLERYKYEEVEAWIVKGKDKVKVRIKGEDEEEDD